MKDINRLHSDIEGSGIPILGVSGSQGSIRIDFKDNVTAQQKLDAQAIIDSFDWSDSAQIVWQNLQDRTFALSNLAHSKPDYKLLRAVVLVVMDEINILRAAVVPSLPALTANQIRTAIQNKINTGAADS